MNSSHIFTTSVFVGILSLIWHSVGINVRELSLDFYTVCTIKILTACTTAGFILSTDFPLFTHFSNYHLCIYFIGALAVQTGYGADELLSMAS
jgi:hypothetical protein